MDAPSPDPEALFCIECGYKLHGLPPEGNCPECGMNIWHSVQHQHQKKGWWRHKWDWIPRPVRMALVIVIGGTVLLVGLALIVLPGPAFLVLPLGLAILALEFAWARRWLKRIKQTATGMHERFKITFGAKPQTEQK